MTRAKRLVEAIEAALTSEYDGQKQHVDVYGGKGSGRWTARTPHEARVIRDAAERWSFVTWTEQTGLEVTFHYLPESDTEILARVKTLVRSWRTMGGVWDRAAEDLQAALDGED